MSGRRSSIARNRTRLRPDFGRIAQAVSRPGIDPRAWVSMARIDDDPDAIVWDDELGWLVDVTFVGGSYDGDGPICCRVASKMQGNGVGSYAPPRGGVLCVVVIPDGDPNSDAIIIGQLHDIDSYKAPTRVNGDTIVETGATIGQVSADKTSIVVAPNENLDEEWDEVRICASNMKFAEPAANQAYVRGNDLADAISNFADALTAFCTGISKAPTLLLDTVNYDPLNINTAIAIFKNASNQYLSTKIYGD